MFGILKNISRIGEPVSKLDNKVALEDSTLEDFSRLLINRVEFKEDRRIAFIFD